MQVHRWEYLGTSIEDGDIRLFIDCVVRNGIFHGFVYGAPVDAFEHDLPLYRTLLMKTIYP